jgi:hypothetical protein
LHIHAKIAFPAQQPLGHLASRRISRTQHKHSHIKNQLADIAGVSSSAGAAIRMGSL